LREVEARQREILLLTPNLPHASTPRGPDASGNVIVRTVGEPREFDFAPLCHWDLGARLGILDLERAANISGSGFYFLTGAGARLGGSDPVVHDTHVTEHGYLEVAPRSSCGRRP
jgi:seryl-tRNA synthetase